MKLLRLLLQRWKSVVLTLVVLLYLFLRFVVARPAPADPKALNHPLYGPIINAEKVNIEVISVNGTQVPGNSLRDAAAALDKYVKGEVKVVQGEPLTLGENEIFETNGKPIFNKILEKRSFRGPSDITLVLLPTLHEIDGQSGYAFSVQPWSWGQQQYNQWTVMLNVKGCETWPDYIPFIPRELFYTLILSHEFFHCLGVPSASLRQYSPYGTGNHCANPWCLLFYRGLDYRYITSFLVNFHIQRDLCADCQREIFEYQLGPYEPLSPDEPFDAELYWMNGLVDLNPSDPKAYQTQSSIFFHRGEYAKAVESCSRGLELDSRLPKFYQIRASSYLYLQEYAKAIHDCSRGLEIDPKNSWLYANRGSTYKETGKAENALSDFEKAIELVTPSMGDTKAYTEKCYNLRGEVYFNPLKDYKRAREEFTKTIELVPNNFKNYYNRGVTSLYLEDYLSAIEDSSVAIALNSTYASAYSLRGQSFEHLGDTSCTVTDYVTVTDLNPDDDWAMNALAWLLATEPDEILRDGGWAVELATQACEKTGWTNAAYLDTLGAAYAERGDFETAVEYTQQAMALMCDSTEEALYQEHVDSYQKREPVRRTPNNTVNSVSH